MTTKFVRIVLMLGLGAMLSSGLVACGGATDAPEPAPEAPVEGAPAE